MAKVLFIGIGNRYRQDDGAGLTAASRLRQMSALFVIPEPKASPGVCRGWPKAEESASSAKKQIPRFARDDRAWQIPRFAPPKRNGVRDDNFELLQIKEESGEGTALMQAWENHDAVILCDAISSGAAPGTIKRFNAREQKIPAQVCKNSTHAFSLPQGLELARSLNRLPPVVIVYGIEGKNFTSGEGLSPEVEQGVNEVVAFVLRDLEIAILKADSSRSALGMT